MKVVVITDQGRKNEFLNSVSGDIPGVSWQAEPAVVPGAEFCIDLLFDESPSRVRQLREAFPIPVAVSAITTTISELAPGFIRFNGWPGFLKGPLLEAAANDENKIIAEKGFALFNKKPEWLPDLPGFITARVVSMIINEAYYALDEKLSSKQEIDTAMKLGTNYPMGPFEWSEKIGLANIAGLLEKLSVTNNRYLPSPLLKKLATDKWG